VFHFQSGICGGTILEELRLGHPELGSESGRLGSGLTIATHSTPSFEWGQQRRLALAVQLIRQPHLLLMDEPTAGLDWSMRQQLLNLLAKPKDWTLLVVTHDAGELLAIADQCWTLNHGCTSLHLTLLRRNLQHDA